MSTKSSMRENASIARRMYEAYVREDRTAIESLIADDFRFSSPLDNAIDRATYFARCWPNSATITAFRFVQVVPHADRVFVTYEGTSTAGHCFRNTEVLTIREGRVTQAEVYFGWSVPHPAPPGGFLDGGG